MVRRVSELLPAERRRLLRVGAELLAVWVGLFGAYAIAPLDGRWGGTAAVRLAAALAVFVALAVWNIQKTRSSEYPMLRAVEAIGILLPLLLVLFSGAYFSLSSASPESFSESLDHIDALYFTITTLGTVGFGDIAANSTGARILVSVQIMLDLLFIGVIVRVLGNAARSGLAGRTANDAAPATSDAS